MSTVEEFVLDEKEVDFSQLFPGGNPPAANTVLDLAALQNLKPPSDVEEFIPKKIFVRQEMLTIWEKLRTNDEDAEVKSQVLLGSPGVGKSVVIFLHAMRRASAGKKVMYFRKTTYEDDISLFCMDKLDNGKVRVRYDRKVPKEQMINSMYSAVAHQAFPDLYQPASVEPIKRQTAGLKKRKEILFFVDGPRHNEKDDTIAGSVHYLCTSGGHPWPADESLFSKLLLVMSAWDKVKYCKALEHFKEQDTMKKLRNYFMGESEESENEESMEVDDHKDEGMTDEEMRDDEVFNCVFYYTGGRIREAVRIVSGSRTIEQYSGMIEPKIASIDGNAAELALTSTECSASKKSIDSFRSMFRLESGAAFQIVDSQFILSLLENKVATEKYLNSFKRALKENQKAVAGYHFEAMLHSVFCEATHGDDDPVQESLKGTGNGKEGVQQLVRRFMYWMPSTSNFANIDAAWVDGHGIIFCIQLDTVQADHKFNSTTFVTKFLRQLPGQLGAQTTDQSARIIFVVPDDVEFSMPDTDPYSRKLVKINCESIEKVKASTAAIFEGGMLASGV